MRSRPVSEIDLALHQTTVVQSLEPLVSVDILYGLWYMVHLVKPVSGPLQRG